MSIHSLRSMKVAAAKGAQAATSFERWRYFAAMSKRELAELVVHLAALATDSYDETITDDGALIARVDAERAALRDQGML